MLWFKKKKKKKSPPGHRTNFQKSIDQNQSFFIPGLTPNNVTKVSEHNININNEIIMLTCCLKPENQDVIIWDYHRERNSSQNKKLLHLEEG